MTPFKLSFFVARLMRCLFTVFFLSTISMCKCFWETEKCCSSEDDKDFWWAWCEIKEGLHRHQGRGIFRTQIPGSKFCDYVALHHKELLWFFYSSGSELTKKSLLVRQCAVNASHFIEFFASLILLLRCTSLLLNWIDSHSPLSRPS